MMDSTKLSEALTDFHIYDIRPAFNEHGEREVPDTKRVLSDAGVSYG